MRVSHEYCAFDTKAPTFHDFDVAKGDIKEKDVILTGGSDEGVLFEAMLEDLFGAVSTSRKRYVDAKDITYVVRYVVCPLCDKEIVVKVAKKEEKK